MSKQVYISADYAENNGDREIVDVLVKWGSDDLHKVEFKDMSKVSKGSVSNQQIKASSAVVFVVGDRTKDREAGSNCPRVKENFKNSKCTPYKQNVNGIQPCKVEYTCSPVENDHVGIINNYSYLKHEFEAAKKCNKTIIVVYNALNKMATWLPSYMKSYENDAEPFWVKNDDGNKIANYKYIKEALGF